MISFASIFLISCSSEYSGTVHYRLETEKLLREDMKPTREHIYGKDLYKHQFHGLYGIYLTPIHHSTQRETKRVLFQLCMHLQPWGASKLLMFVHNFAWYHWSCIARGYWRLHFRNKWPYPDQKKVLFARRAICLKWYIYQSLNHDGSCKRHF